MTIENEVVVCIPTYRKPPIKTLQHYKTKHHVLVIADPDVLDQHVVQAKRNGYDLASGVKGMSAQVAECYRRTYQLGFPWFFRLDDDLEPKTFIHMDKHFPDLDEVIREAFTCALTTGASLAGFANTTNRHWMDVGYGKTRGLIHGAAHICRSAEDPSDYIDTRIQYFEDVYRSLAHRKKDGAVGRVKFIGMDKKSSSERVEQAMSEQEGDIKLILETFPGMVSFEGFKIINNGEYVVPNWRYKK